MKGVILFLLVFSSLQVFSQNEKGASDQSLIQTIIVLSILLLAVFAYELNKYIQKKKPSGFRNVFSKVQLEIQLGKDRLFRPQVLTMTITNTGKKDVNIDSPVLEFRKIWSKRKFRLNGINGHHIYPMCIGSGLTHQLRIETSTFYQYDRSIKSYYWAQIIVRDVKGRKFNSNKVKLRKSLVT